MEKFKSMAIGELLTEKQIEELTELVNTKSDLEAKDILPIIKRDDSKYKGKAIPEYLAYAVLYELTKRVDTPMDEDCGDLL